MSALQTMAQEVYLDKVSDDGSRMVAVQRDWFNEHSLFNAFSPLFSIGFSAVDTLYFLNIGIYSYDQKYTFPTGGKVLIRTTKGDVLRFTMTSETRMSFVETKWDSTLKKYIDKYSGDLLFFISTTDIQKITTDGIVKLRIEITNGEYIEHEKDMSKKKDKKAVESLTKWLNDSFSILNDRLSNPPIDISEDF